MVFSVKLWNANMSSIRDSNMVVHSNAHVSNTSFQVILKKAVPVHYSIQPYGGLTSLALVEYTVTKQQSLKEKIPNGWVDGYLQCHQRMVTHVHETPLDWVVRWVVGRPPGVVSVVTVGAFDVVDCPCGVKQVTEIYRKLPYLTRNGNRKKLNFWIGNGWTGLRPEDKAICTKKRRHTAYIFITVTQN